MTQPNTPADPEDSDAEEGAAVDGNGNGLGGGVEEKAGSRDGDGGREMYRWVSRGGGIVFGVPWAFLPDSTSTAGSQSGTVDDTGAGGAGEGDKMLVDGEGEGKGSGSSGSVVRHTDVVGSTSSLIDASASASSTPAGAVLSGSGSSLPAPTGNSSSASTSTHVLPNSLTGQGKSDSSNGSLSVAAVALPRPPAICDVAGCLEKRKYRVVRDFGKGACGIVHLKQLERSIEIR